MCFFIWNSWTSEKQILNFSDKLNCENCHNAVNPYLLKVTRWQFILLLILPIVFPSSIDYYIVCPICKNGVKIQNSDARQMIKNAKIANNISSIDNNDVHEYNPYENDKAVGNKDADKKKTALGFSLASLILGLIGIVAIFCGNEILLSLGIIAGIFAIVFGIVAHFKKPCNKIIANTGITMGSIATLICSIILISMLVSAISVGLPHSPVGNWVSSQYDGTMELTMTDNYHGSLCLNYYNNFEEIEKGSWLYDIGYRGFIKTLKYDISLEQFGTNIYRFTTSNDVYIETYYPQNGYLRDDGYDETYSGTITLNSDKTMNLVINDETYKFIKSG